MIVCGILFFEKENSINAKIKEAALLMGSLFFK